MDVPLEISFRNIDNTDLIEDLVRRKVTKLEAVAGRLTSCRVAIEMPHRHKQTGNPYRVRVEVNLPGVKSMTIKREAGDDPQHESLEALVREVFESARRRVREVVEQQHGSVKLSPAPEEVAIVAKLFPDRDYGFLETLDRREIYFHRNSVLNGDFDRLEIGTGVRFTEEEGDKGPQASSLRIVNKPGVSSPKSPPTGLPPQGRH
jgi:cold shock CspA family protein/ribosome-associated translation inhibitor RaiA